MPVLDDRGTTPWIARTAHYATTTSQREAVCSACCSTRPRGSSCPGTKVGKRRVVEDEDDDDSTARGAGDGEGLAAYFCLAGMTPRTPPPGIVHVADGAGDDVDVAVHDGLARGVAGVDADVVAVGAVGPVEELFQVGDAAPQLGLLPGRGVEIGGHMPQRHHQGVPGGHRKPVPHHDDEARRPHDVGSVRSAEEAGCSSYPPAPSWWSQP